MSLDSSQQPRTPVLLCLRVAGPLPPSLPSLLPDPQVLAPGDKLDRVQGRHRRSLIPVGPQEQGSGESSGHWKLCFAVSRLIIGFTGLLGSDTLSQTHTPLFKLTHPLPCPVVPQHQGRPQLLPQSQPSRIPPFPETISPGQRRQPLVPHSCGTESPREEPSGSPTPH